MNQLPEGADNVLRIYAEQPMASGDVLILVDGRTCMEVTGLADEWDDQLCRNVAKVLRQTTTIALLAIARPGASMLARDVQLWCDLAEELSGSVVELLPLECLPAA